MRPASIERAGLVVLRFSVLFVAPCVVLGHGEESRW